MEERDDLNTTEARAGVTPHIGRYILPTSVALIVLAFVILLLLFW